MKFVLILIVILFQSSFSPAAEKNLALEKEAWASLEYRKISPNIVVFENNSMQINVDKSSSPMVYKFNKPQTISGFTIKGEFHGIKKIETTKFDEDSILRFGAVAVGDQKLTGIKSYLAPLWIRKLFSLAPPGLGLDKVYFSTVTNRKDMVGKSRVHPKSELLVERLSYYLDQEGPFTFTEKFEKPLEIAAVWLGADGDNTKSKFNVTITSIVVQE